MEKILSKTEYKEQDTIFKAANMTYSEYLEFMQLQQNFQNVDEFVVWQTGMATDEESNDEDQKESSGPCGACTSLEGQIFHISSVPPPPHDHCKCGTIPLRFHIIYEQMSERLKRLEDGLKKANVAKKEALDKFKKSGQLDKNIKEAKNMSWKQWYDSVKTGGEWDYKSGHPEMEHTGNVNAGATGRAAGIPASALKIGAGAYQIKSGTSSPEFWNSNFDDPVDQEYIQQGIDYYDENYGD